MLTMPAEIMVVLQHFAPVFSERIWDWVQVLVLGAILAPKQRTVTAILRIMGLSQERQYQNYHRVLNRAHWSSLRVSRILLGLLVAAFVQQAHPSSWQQMKPWNTTRKTDRGQRAFPDAVLSSEKHSIAVKACAG